MLDLNFAITVIGIVAITGMTLRIKPQLIGKLLDAFIKLTGGHF